MPALPLGDTRQSRRARQPRRGRRGADPAGVLRRLRSLGVHPPDTPGPVVDPRAPGRANEHARHRLAAESVTRWPDPDLYIEPDRWERGHRPLDVHPDPERQLAWRIYATTAMHSISTRAPNASPLPATVERAGGSFGKNVAYTTFIAA